MKRFLSTILALTLCTYLCMAVSAAEPAGFELPLAGTTGYGVIDLALRAGDSSSSEKLGTLPAGEAFTIISEGKDYFNIRTQRGNEAWVSKTYTMVNLPDLIPSIRYNATNSYDSLYRSCGKDIPGVTGKAFYTGKTANAKLGYEEFNMPVLYGMAKKIAAAQAAALSDGRTLVLYEGYRPLSVQREVNSGLSTLTKSDSAVNYAMSSSGWSKGWFIAKSISNHQKGFAIDVSLAEVIAFKNITIDGQNVKMPAQIEEKQMPTSMHELSPAAASMAYGVDSKSATAWRNVPAAGTMTESANMLRTYCTDAGLSPLASEWWHFNDLEARSSTKAAGTGGFEIMGNVSLALA